MAGFVPVTTTPAEPTTCTCDAAVKFDPERVNCCVWPAEIDAGEIAVIIGTGDGETLSVTWEGATFGVDVVAVNETMPLPGTCVGAV